MGLSFYRPDRLSAETLAEIEAMNDRLGAGALPQPAGGDHRARRQPAAAAEDPLPVAGDLRHARQRTPPACSWEIASAVKGAELHLLAECGHCSPIEDPAAVNALLGAWLERATD